VTENLGKAVIFLLKKSGFANMEDFDPKTIISAKN